MIRFNFLYLILNPPGVKRFSLTKENVISFPVLGVPPLLSWDYITTTLPCLPLLCQWPHHSKKVPHRPGHLDLSCMLHLYPASSTTWFDFTHLWFLKLVKLFMSNTKALWTRWNPTFFHILLSLSTSQVLEIIKWSLKKSWLRNELFFIHWRNFRHLSAMGTDLGVISSFLGLWHPVLPEFKVNQFLGQEIGRLSAGVLFGFSPALKYKGHTDGTRNTQKPRSTIRYALEGMSECLSQSSPLLNYKPGVGCSGTHL